MDFADILMILILHITYSSSNYTTLTIELRLCCCCRPTSFFLLSECSGKAGRYMVVDTLPIVERSLTRPRWWRWITISLMLRSQELMMASTTLILKNPRLAQHSTLIKAFSAGFSLCGMLLEGEWLSCYESILFKEKRRTHFSLSLLN